MIRIKNPHIFPVQWGSHSCINVNINTKQSIGMAAVYTQWH